MKRPRQIAPAALAGGLAMLLLATLWPAAAPLALAPDSQGLGGALLADALRNVLLFVPIGVALALWRLRAAWGLALAAALSGSIELTQLLVPGRHGSGVDLLANVVGAGLGIAAARRAPAWLQPARSGPFVLAAAVAAATVLFAAGALLAPAPTPLPFFGHHTPDLGHLHPYAGRVVSASLDGLAIAHGRLANSDGIRRRLTRDHELRIRAVAGRPPPGQASLVSITDEDEMEILLVGPDREDLVYRFRSRAASLGFEGAALRLAGALEGIAAGATIDVRVQRLGADFCVQIDAAQRCGLGFTVGDGWSILAPEHRLLDAARPALGAVWVAALLFPLGFWGRLDTATALAGAIAAAALLVGPRWGDLLPTPVAQLVGAACGVAAGAGLRRIASWSGRRRP